MSESYLNLTAENVDREHLCCALADKKHQAGADANRNWLKERFKEGHTFRKLDAQGKIFIEYAPLETAWTPVDGDNYLYIYCLWVSGSYAGKGHGQALLQYCIDDARAQAKSGVCVISSKKKKPFLSDKKFMLKHGFEVVDAIGDYELLALSFEGSDSSAGSRPHFRENARRQSVASSQLTIYYGMQCPYIANCIEQIAGYCGSNGIDLDLVAVDTLEKAKNAPGVFNNWAVFYGGAFETVHLLNEGYLKKLLALR